MLDLHQLVDGLEEVELGSAHIGTTRKGIGPTYSSKAARSGIRVCELFEWDQFEKKVRQLEYGFRRRFGDLLKYDVEEELKKFKVGAGLNVTLSCSRMLTSLGNRNIMRPYVSTLLMQYPL